MADIEARIMRARELLRTARHAAIATVNEDGSPHNTPVFFLHSADLRMVYWGSYPGSRHSKNILRSGQLFVAVYDMTAGGGLYIKAANGHITEGTELEEALRVHNDARARESKDPLPLSYYVGDSPQRMWSADVVQLWVNNAERDSKGYILQDLRYEISAQDLLH